jgi:hypothetical protein
MFRSLCAALALAMAGAVTLTPAIAASVGAPGLSTERLITPVASKKKLKAKKCRKGKVYSQRRHKCVWQKKRHRAKAVATTVAPAKKK